MRNHLHPVKKSLHRVRFACLAATFLLGASQGRADTASVVAAANTLLATSEAANPGATSASTLPAVMTDSYTLAIAKQWTNLPGGTRNGPTIGGGPAALTTDLSATVPSGQTVSPRAAAIALAQTALSTAGYNTMNEIRNADDVIRATDNTQSWNYGNYHIAILGTPSTTTPWMLQISGHHLTYNITYNGPYVGATPMFIGTEPPNYFSIGTDLTTTEQTVVFGTDAPTTTGGTGPGTPPGGGGPGSVSVVTVDDTAPTTVTPEESFVSNPYNSTSATTLYATTDVSSVLTGATAISGATSATYSIAATTSADNGFYYCVATNASGSSTSNTVAVTVTTQANNSLYNSTTSSGTTPAPVFTTQPLSQTVATGDSVTLTVVASNATSYQWYKVAATLRNPLETQRAAVSALANSIQADTTNASASILTGQTFSDVVMGVTNAGDGNFPFIGTTPTYPTGTTGRGVLYTSLNATEQAEVVTMIQAWVNTQASDVAASLLTDYLSPSALAQTYVGYQVGAGIADGGTATRCNFDPSINQEADPINSQNSYLRVDGPRVWIEMVVQAAVAFKAYGFVHYHSLWRDKLADYGNEFGGYLDTTNTDTTYTRPTISTQPAAASVVTGGSTSFSVTATGTGTLAYQWYFNSVPISGATRASYSVTNASSASTGNYYVVVSNAYGVVTSATAALSVTTVTDVSPTITTQPVSQSVTVGDSVSFAVAATGSGTLAYQWYMNGIAISGANAANYTIVAAALTDAGPYYVVVSNDAGSITSAVVTLTVSSPAGTTPAITTQPVSQSITAGNSVTFMVAASGTGTLAYQWYFNGVAISGATNPTYSIAAVATTDAGSYYVTVTNDVGTVTSSIAALTVTAVTGETTPTITTQPISQSASTETSVTFSVVATGSGTLAYQWYKDGTAVSGATASSFTITSVASTDAGSYDVTVTNSVGSVTSTTAVLTVNAVSVPVVTCAIGGTGIFYEGESQPKGKVIFTRTGSTTDALTVYYQVKGPGNGTDYVGPDGGALSGTAVIPAGASVYKLKLTPTNAAISATEKVRIFLSASPTNTYTVGTAGKAKLFLEPSE